MSSTTIDASPPPSPVVPGSSRRRGRRWWQLWAGVLAALYAVGYLLPANLFLNLEWIQDRLNRKPETFHLQWQGGWTVLPGLVRLHGVKMRGQSRSVQWQMALDSAWLQINLLALPAKRFSGHGLRGDGLEFQLRRRVDWVLQKGAAAGTEPRLAPAEWTPRIGTWSNPPERKPEELYERPQKDRTWRIDLRDIRVAGLREIWLDEYRLQGAGEVEGRIGFHIRRELEVSDGRIAMAQGRLGVADRQVNEDLMVEWTGALSSFHPRQLRGREVYRQLQGHLEIAAPDANLDFLSHLFRPAPWLGIQGRGQLEASLEVRDGRLVNPSRMSVTEAELEVDLVHHRVRGRGRAQATVAGELGQGHDTRARFDVDFATFRVSRPTEEGLEGDGIPDEALVEGEGLQLTAEVPEIDLVGPPAEVSAVLVLADARVPDLALYNPYLPEAAGLRVAHGSGRLSGELRLSTQDEPGPGSLHLTASDVALELGEASLDGQLDLRLVVRQEDREARRFGIAGSRLDVREARFDAGEGEAQGDQSSPWWMWLEVPAGSLEVREPLGAQGRFRAGMKDPAPLVAVAASRNKAVGWLSKMLDVQGVQASGELSVDRGEISVKHLAVDGEKLAIRSDLCFADKSAQGAMYLRYGILDVALALTPEGRNWQVLRPKQWYEEETGHGIRWRDEGDP